jgi:hypothetical protein
MTAVDRLLDGIEAGNIPADVFTTDAVLDATVPDWRFAIHGGPDVRDKLAHWFENPGEFQSLERKPLPDGELVRFTLTWTEGGEEFTCHQAHILGVLDDRIASDTVFCGGRWSAELAAKMHRVTKF